MSYQSLQELLKEHSDEDVFRAAMSWLSIRYEARWRMEYKKEHGHYPTMSEGAEHRRNTRYYLPPKARPHDSDQEVDQPANSSVCIHCGERTWTSDRGDEVCTNQKCFAHGS